MERLEVAVWISGSEIHEGDLIDRALELMLDKLTEEAYTYLKNHPWEYEDSSACEKQVDGFTYYTGWEFIFSTKVPAKQLTYLNLVGILA